VAETPVGGIAHFGQASITQRDIGTDGGRFLRLGAGRENLETLETSPRYSLYMHLVNSGQGGKIPRQILKKRLELALFALYNRFDSPLIVSDITLETVSYRQPVNVGAKSDSLNNAGDRDTVSGTFLKHRDFKRKD
jgi:hypothetical protein